MILKHVSITKLALLVLLGAVFLTTVRAQTSPDVCGWILGDEKARQNIPDEPRSYIVKCMTGDSCGELARTLLRIVGDSADINVFGNMGILTGRFDSSIIRLLCRSKDLKRLIDMIEMDQVVGYDHVISSTS
ncbi:hypothetical protein PSENEW3_00004707 [Picochlorum sp. SENEW3]|nr:hypothetical protein PSENEW3_00004707 [Picochlorum sp. SENEW3]